MPRIRWQRLRKLTSARHRRDWSERYALRDAQRDEIIDARGETVRDEQNRVITTHDIRDARGRTVRAETYAVIFTE